MTAIRTNVLRNTMIATAALIGTVATFGVTTTPVRAAETYYTAKLAAPVDGEQRAVLGDTMWTCAGDSCTAPRDTSRPKITCERLVKKFGEVSSFATPKGELSGKKLAGCNAKA